MTYDPNQPPQSPFAPPEPDAARPPQPVQPTPSYIPPTVAAAVASPRPRRGVSAGTIAFVAAIVVAGAGLGFAAGRLTAPAAPSRAAFAGQFGGNFNGQSGANPNASGNPNRGGFGGFGGFGGGSISIDGQVTAVSSGSITVQTVSGQSVTLQVPGSATYHTQASGSSSDVTVGSNVQVSVSRPARAEASGQPNPGGQSGQGGGLQLTVTDITVLAK